MKKTTHIRLLSHVFITLMITFLASCEKKDGYATAPDFEQKEFQLSGDQHMLTLRAKNDLDWFLADLTINGEVLRPENWDGDSRVTYYSAKENEANSPQSHLSSVYKIEFEDWFVWERLNIKTIKIQLSQNKDGKRRTIGFQASVGNAGDNISIMQSSDN
ncbi:hypothetical protein PQ465_14075 [Sphingobacterium oryzagri]|uniref:HmuY protein n=1 Tax=Sphingobacterium oryzagri TaxID=3025669 RepID=A0ABY7WCP9_9SPHI|nr:hypothetical protein [Sphingobacterium sp. KACC 22765]WDF67429.1 hypothetical protein PQ465_14075 [Sphingobacterium sp. KACC 22765]